MSRTWLRRAITIVTASAVFAIPFSFSAHAAVRAGAADVHSAGAARAADPGGDKLAAAMLQNGDLPAGFQPYAPLTGPMNAKRAQVLGIDMSQLGGHEEWVRTWTSQGIGDEVIETAADDGTSDVAQAGVAASAPDLLKQGLVRQPIAGPPSRHIADTSRSTASDISCWPCRWLVAPTISACACTSRPSRRRRPAA